MTVLSPTRNKPAADSAATDHEPGRTGAPVSAHAELLRAVKDAGLLKRTRGFYIVLLSVLALTTAGIVTGGVVLGETWFQLLIAGGLGIVFAQFAFFAHEASHGQVFASQRRNRRASLWVGTGVAGVSASWWLNKHSRHHANPNKIGRDPDIDMAPLAFDTEAAHRKRGLWAAITRHQGWLFFPLLTLEGLNLHVQSIRSVFRRNSRASWLERIVLVARLTLYPAAVLLLLGPAVGVAFLGVQLAVFGVYMGMSFAPNHKGMPVISADSKLDFLRKQVLTSRNIRGRAMTLLMGGLNHQIEHHLFPTMPRPHLRRAAAMVRRRCEELRIPYHETSAPRSYAQVVSYLNKVGLHARNPFDCPLAHTLAPELR